MTDNRGISDIEIERYVQNELSPSRISEIERRRVDDPILAARISSLTASNLEILEAYPPKQMAAAIREAATFQSALPARSARFFTLPALGVAAAAVLLTVILLPGKEHLPENKSAVSNQSPEGIRLKGPTSPSLFVFRKGESGDERLLTGQSAAPGDVIQLKYAAKGAPYGVIFSIDGRGTVTLHYPSSNALPATLDSKGTHALDFSYELDDAPEYERFFFVTANHPIDPTTVIEKAQLEKPGATKRLSLDPTLSQCDFVLKKTR